jgi:polyphenol oxidase
MFTEIINGVEVLCFNNLSWFKDISHFITIRKGGFSKGIYESLNLSLNVGDCLDDVMKNRENISSIFNINTTKLFIPSQCHTKNVKIISDKTRIEDLAETDALTTNLKGHALAVLAADCVPILLFDPVEHTVAAIHAGWRGTILNIVASTIDTMIHDYHCNPENLFAGIGPCISKEIYEVDEGVASEFRKLFGNNSLIIQPGKIKGKSHINLQAANRNLLIQKGVMPGNIEIADICTYKHPELFFSARRDRSNCGRFASAIMLKN